MSEGGKKAVRADDHVVSAAEVRALKKQIRELERFLGNKTMEVEISRMPSRSHGEESDHAHGLALRGR